MPPSRHAPLDTDHLLPPHQKKPMGPAVGTVIVVMLLLLGALYFWGAALNRGATQNQVPYIPNGTTTITVTQ